jgi:hypothetical protein
MIWFFGEGLVKGWSKGEGLPTLINSC